MGVKETNEKAKDYLRTKVYELRIVLYNVDQMVAAGMTEAATKGIEAKKILSIDAWRQYNAQQPGSTFSPENIIVTLFKRRKKSSETKSFDFDHRIKDRTYKIKVTYSL